MVKKICRKLNKIQSLYFFGGGCKKQYFWPFFLKFILTLSCISIFQNLNPIKSELKMKSYMADILEGLNYLHQKGNLTI